MRALNQVNIIDLKGDLKRKTVSLGGVKSREKVLNDRGVPRWMYYSNIALGDKYIYALYENQDYSLGDDDVKRKGEVHVIDYEGNFRCIVPLDRFLYSISYSPLDNSIYGLDDKEGLYKFSLPEI